MSTLLRWAPLLPAALPLLLALLAPSVRRPRVLGLLALVGLGLAALPLLPWPGLPRITPLVGVEQASPTAEELRWSTGTAGRPARAALALILLALAALGLWSVARLHDAPVHLARSRDGHRPSLQMPFAGLLLAVGGGQLALLATTPLAACMGVGMSALGMLLVDLAGAPPGEDKLAGALPLLLGPLLLGVAAIGTPDTTATRVFWAGGCALLIFAVPLRLGLGRAPLLLSGVAQALGVAPVAAVLLVPGHVPGVAPTSAGFAALAAAGGAAFVLGTANTAAAATLRATLCAQWVAQLGLVMLALGIAPEGPGTAALRIAALANAVGSTVVLSLMIGRLARETGVERIADLPPLPAPLRRCGLAYALAAGSAAGLPLTLGYALRRALGASAGSPLLPALLLAGSTLLLLGLAPPLLGLLRRQTGGGGAEPDQRAGAGLLLGLLLVVAGAYPVWATLTRRLLSIGLRDRTLATAVFRDAVPEIAMAAAQVAVVVVLLAITNRSLRRGEGRPLRPGARIEEEPGWALPWTALGDLLRPLTPAPAIETGRRLLQRGTTRLAAPTGWVRAMERRYYLLLIVLATISLVLLAAGEAGV